MFLKPTWQGVSLADFPPAMLYEHGVRGALLDLDNTVMIPRAHIVPEHVQQWLSEAAQLGMGCIIVTNNKKPDYMQRAQEILALPVIGPAYKPSCKGLLAATQQLGLAPHEVVVIGDRPLTDIWGGIRLGGKTLWLKNLTYQSDSVGIQVLRCLEAWTVQRG